MNVLFPDHSEPKSVKGTPEWGKKAASAAFNEGTVNSYTFYPRRDIIKNNQLWSEGGHSIDDFKDDIDTGGDTSWLNYNLDLASPLPKLANLFVGSLTNRSYEIVVDATDNQSRSERDEERKRLERKMFLKPFQEEFEKRGLDVDLKDAPESKDDIDDEMELNYKVPVEEALELTVRDVFKHSGSEEIQRKVAFDIFENNTGCTKIEMVNGQRKFRHVKLENLITSYAIYDDLKDAYYIGEVLQMSVADAMAKYPNKLTQDEWIEVAGNYAGRYGNANFGIEDYYSGTISWESLKAFKVLLFDFQYKTANIYTWKDKTTRGGTRAIKNVSDTYDPTGKHNTKLKKKELIDIYDGVWIVDSEHMLKWELKPNMTRKLVRGELQGDTEFDYTIYRANSRDTINKSLCELIKPHAKQIIIYNLKIMQMVMKSRPAGAAVDVTSLGAIAKGMGDPTLTTTDPMEIYAAFDETGIFAYSSVREDGSAIVNNNPIVPLDGGVASSVQNFLVLRNAEMQEIYNISGFNPAVDGSAPQKDVLVSVEKMRANSFNLTMKPYADSFTKIIQDTASKIAEQEKDLIIADKGYAKLIADKIGKEGVNAIKLISSAKLSELSIHVNFEPEQEDTMNFIQSLQSAVQAGQITVMDEMNAREIAKESVKGAISYLKKAVKRKARQDQEAANENAKVNAQVQQESAVLAEQLKLKTIQAEWDAKTQYLILEKKLEGALQKDKAVEERITKVLDAELDEHLLEIQAFPDPNTDTIKSKMGSGSSGETKVSGRVRKKTQGKKVGGKSTTPRVGMSPQDNVKNNIL